MAITVGHYIHVRQVARASTPTSLVGRGCSVRHRRPHVSHTHDTCYLGFPLPLGDLGRPSFPIKKRGRRRKKRGEERIEEKNSSILSSPLFFFFLFFFYPLLPLMFDRIARGVGRLPSVKGFNKTMSSSLGENNMSMMVRSSSKLFWNGVPDRIIRFLVRSSARAFRISLFGRPLLNSYQKADNSIRDSIPEQLCRTSYQHALVTSG